MSPRRWLDKPEIIVFEAFALALLADYLGAAFVPSRLNEAFPGMPGVTIQWCSAALLSPVPVLYLFLRLRRPPSVKLPEGAYTYFTGGVAVVFLTTFVFSRLLGTDAPLLRQSLDAPSPYVFVNVLIITLWGPLMEEILYRGYILSLLRRTQRDAAAVMISTVFFVLHHALGSLGGFLPGAGAVALHFGYIFLHGLIFGITGLRGGLPAAVTVHAAANAFVLLRIS